MAAYIDAHRDRFGVGPICRVLGAASDCGFLTPRGYRMCVLMLLYIVKGFGVLGWLVRGGDGLDPECGASFEFG